MYACIAIQKIERVQKSNRKLNNQTFRLISLRLNEVN